MTARLLLQHQTTTAAAAGAANAAAGAAGVFAVHLLADATDVGTGDPDQAIPSTAAVVGAVVGGLCTLTLCLAGALLFSVARIYGWRWARGVSRRDLQDSKQSDIQDALEAGRIESNLPSIVTTRLVDSGSPLHHGGGDDEWRGHGATAGPRTSSAEHSAPSTMGSLASAGGSLVLPSMRSDANWKDCIIEPDQIQILRRRDGRPWVLGGGAFGQVYKALYDGVQVVAAKVLTGLADERVFQSFVHEAAILRDMRDRNIVQFVGVCMGREEEGQPDEAMMIQEFMEAGDMFKALKWRDQSGRRVYGWYARGKKAASDIARGLHYLHSHKIVHLDMKSSNVLLARDGTCKIADVGLARTLATKNYLSQAGAMGTFAWSAPEVLTGQPVSVKADIYSMGIILWEIVTGDIPQRGTMRNPRVPEECPQAVLDLIDRCTSQNPADRPTARQIVQQLMDVPAGTPDHAAARGAPLRAASIGPWRDQLPQQASILHPNTEPRPPSRSVSVQRRQLAPSPFSNGGGSGSGSGATAFGGATAAAAAAQLQVEQQGQGGEVELPPTGRASPFERPLSSGGPVQPVHSPRGTDSGAALAAARHSRDSEGEDSEQAALAEAAGDSGELEEARRRSEEDERLGRVPPPAPPMPTLRLEDLPPLSEEDRIF